MFKKFALISVSAMLIGTTSYAQGYEDGWNLSFKRDAFDQKIFPEASVYEDGGSSANVSVACGEHGALIPTLFPGSYRSPRSYEVEFKAGPTQRKFTFTAGDIPRLGNRLRLQDEDATAFLDLFANAAEPVAYRTEKHQGSFSSIAARQAIDIVRTYCPK